MQPEILLVCPLYGPTMTTLEERFRVHRLWDAAEPDSLLKEISPRVRAIATSGHAGASAELMQALPKLEIIAGFGVGYDAVDVGAATRRGVKVTNTPDVLNDEVADLAVALLLAVRRRLVAADRFVREGKWLNGAYPLCDKLSGSRCGILGLGRIGKAIAKRLVAFDVEIHYHSRKPQPDQPYRYHADLVAMAREVDNLVAIVPGGRETQGIVSRAVLQALGPKGVFVNVARGGIVDEAAMVELLVSGELGGAGLDVFVEEPRVPEALFALDTVVLQPHQGSATHATRAAMGELVVRNLEAHFAGRPLLTPVN